MVTRNDNNTDRDRTGSTASTTNAIYSPIRASTSDSCSKHHEIIEDHSRKLADSGSKLQNCVGRADADSGTFSDDEFATRHNDGEFYEMSSAASFASSNENASSSATKAALDLSNVCDKRLFLTKKS